jgi:multisubunit Na+/H+ antiporter MnhF subunit
MSAFGFFVALLLVSVAFIVFVLVLVLRSDSSKRFSGISGRIFGGSIFLLVALLGLWRIRSALLDHSVVYATTGYSGTVWMDPWQAIAAYSLILVMGLFLLGSAIQKSRK